MKKDLKWNLQLLVKNELSLKEGRIKVEKETSSFVERWKKNPKYLRDASTLKQALDDYENWQRNYSTDGSEGYYYSLKLSQNQIDPKIKAKFNSIYEFSNKLRVEISFFELSLAKIDQKLQTKFLNDRMLAPYKHLLEKLFLQSKHLLTEAEEKILILKSPTSYTNWIQMTSGFLSKEESSVLVGNKKEIKNFSEILNLMNDTDKNTRDSAAQVFNEILAKYKDVAEIEINSILQNKKIDDDLRDFKRADESRILNDDVTIGIVDVLIDTVSQRNDISQRFYKLKAELLGVEKLQYHERNVEVGEINKEYSFNESRDLVLKVFNNLDPEFERVFERLLKNNQLDVYPYKGKRSGAFCAYNLISQPTFVLLNHTDKLRDVLTLAHEMGHAINNELIKERQNSLNFGTPTSTAEVASTFMEDFVLQEILKKADDKLKLGILMTRLNDDVSTIFRQIACFKFEQELHSQFRAKGYLSHIEIGKIFQEKMADYMGPAVEQSKGSENWWIYWNHIRSYFYVYSYASGLLISKSLQGGVKENPQFIEKVKVFLSTGLSLSPKDIFLKLGIDIEDKEFWNKGLDEIENLLTETEKLAKRVQLKNAN